MALQCEVCILIAQLYFTSKVITNKSQVDCVSTGQNSIECWPMGTIRGGEVGRGRGRTARQASEGMKDEVGGWWSRCPVL